MIKHVYNTMKTTLMPNGQLRDKCPKCQLKIDEIIEKSSCRFDNDCFHKYSNWSSNTNQFPKSMRNLFVHFAHDHKDIFDGILKKEGFGSALKLVKINHKSGDKIDDLDEFVVNVKEEIVECDE